MSINTSFNKRLTVSGTSSPAVKELWPQGWSSCSVFAFQSTLNSVTCQFALTSRNWGYFCFSALLGIAWKTCPPESHWTPCPVQVFVEKASTNEVLLPHALGTGTCPTPRAGCSFPFAQCLLVDCPFRSFVLVSPWAKTYLLSMRLEI